MTLHRCRGIVSTAQAEVFSILFVLEQDEKHIVRCLSCARKVSPTLKNFTILNQYKLDELMDVYDAFQLGSTVSTLTVRRVSVDVDGTVTDIGVVHRMFTDF